MERERRAMVMKTDDIKALLENSKALQAIIGGIGDAISIQNTDLRVLYQNESHRKLLGDHVGEYCYKSFRSRDSVCEGCPLVMAFQDEQIHTAVRKRTTGAGVAYMEVTSSAIKGESGRIVAGIEVVRDITGRKRLEEEREKLVRDLQDALARIKTLKGFIPICASCKNIRNDSGYWERIESYFKEFSDVEFSHSICPSCAKKLYPDFIQDE